MWFVGFDVSDLLVNVQGCEVSEVFVGIFPNTWLFGELFVDEYSGILLLICLSVWVPHSNVSLSTWCVCFAEWRSLICLLLSSQNFRSLIGFGCPSQDLLSVSSLVAGIRCEVSDLLYVPGYKVCEWFVGVFCRTSCLWSVWVHVLGCKVSDLFLYFLACEVCEHFVTLCPRMW